MEIRLCLVDDKRKYECLNIIEQYCTAGDAWLLRAGRLRTSRADAVPCEPRLFHSSCNPMVILPKKCFGKSSSSFGSAPDIGQLFHHQILFLYTDIKIIYMPNHRRFITSTTIKDTTMQTPNHAARSPCNPSPISCY